MTTITSHLITVDQRENSKLISAHCSVSEAAKRLDVSESTIRRHAKKHGVTKIAGRCVAGFILFPTHPVPICVAFSNWHETKHQLLHSVNPKCSGEPQ